MISIVLPAYNTSELLLQNAIASVLNQSYSDWELLVIDDSTIAPVEKIVKRFPDKRIRYIQNERNFGMSGARNRGIELAKGEFVALLDHDDCFLPHKLDRLLSAFSTNPEAELVYSMVCNISDGKKQNQSGELYETAEGLIRRNSIISCSAVMFRRSFVTECGLYFSKEAEPCDDYDFYLRAALHGSIIAIPEVLVNRNLHGENTSRNLLRMHRGAIFVLQRNYPALRRKLPYGPMKLVWFYLRSLSWAHRAVAVDLLQMHESKKEVFQELLLAFLCCPVHPKNIQVLFRFLLGCLCKCGTAS